MNPPLRLLLHSVTVISVAWLVFIGFAFISGFGLLAVVLAPLWLPLWLGNLLAAVAWHYLLRLLCSKMQVTPGTIGRLLWISTPALPILLLLGLTMWEMLPMNQFNNYLGVPAPASVESLRIGSDQALLMERTALYFEIAPEDFPKLLAPYDYKETKTNRTTLPDEVAGLLDIPEAELLPCDVYEVDLLTEEEKEAGTSLNNLIYVNKPKNRVLFLHLYHN